MLPKIKTEYGTVTIENEVIARIAGLAAMDSCGIVGMAAKNVRDGFAQLLKKESLTKGVHLEIKEDSVVIDLHIIVLYFTNIPAITESLVSAVKYKVEEYAGLNVGRVNIYVEGVRVDG